MKYPTLIIAVCFCLLAPLVSGLSEGNKTTIENSAKGFVDSGLVEKVAIAVQPPDSIWYNIIPNSGSNEDLATANIVGVSLFSLLTAYHPEVTKGAINLMWDVPTGGSKLESSKIYQSDLGQITDRKNPTLSEAMQVANIITERAMQEKQ